MSLKTTNREYIDEVEYGVYVWFVGNKVLKDEDDNFLNIPAMRGDRKRIALLAEAVRSYGIDGGRPVFLSGNRQVTDEEYEEQQQRMLLGLTPDPMDVPAIVSDRRARK
jgi:hypothetical protein